MGSANVRKIYWFIEQSIWKTKAWAILGFTGGLPHWTVLPGYYPHLGHGATFLSSLKTLKSKAQDGLLLKSNSGMGPTAYCWFTDLFNVVGFTAMAGKSVLLLSMVKPIDYSTSNMIHRFTENGGLTIWHIPGTHHSLVWTWFNLRSAIPVHISRSSHLLYCPGPLILK